MSEKWRIINEGKYSEAMHHALDEVLIEKMNDSEMRPTLRFWYRPHTTIPMGRFQAYHDEVEHDFVKDNDIEVVRRITGGGAMFSEPGKVITYSIYIPKDQVNENIQESYKELDNFAVKALKDLGVDAEYKPLNDIEHPDGKLGGASQIRKQNAVLHHTMMSYDLDTRKMLKALRIGKEKVSDKAIESAEKRVARISDYVDDSREEVIEALISSFVDDKNWDEGSLTEEEIEKAEKLADEKFRSEEWNKKL
ncbi:MAG: biotin/lipoate A/B protein ligase family protein [Candidatus Nanohaloarchaea archaeon]